jgi:hypothetical protein
MELSFEKWMQQMKDLQTPPTRQPPPAVTTKRRLSYTNAELHAKALTIAYVARNADGSFTQFKIHKTEIKAAWTTIVAETQSNQNAITDLRLAPLDEWEDPERRKRNVFARGVTVQPNECLQQCLRKQSMGNPVLLVCWERPPTAPQQPDPTPKICCKRKTWHYFLFTNGIVSDGKPVVLVHTASGTKQLAEAGIQTVSSSPFIQWVSGKVNTAKWEIVSLTELSASVRIRLDADAESI